MSTRLLFTLGSVFLVAHLLCLGVPSAFGQGTATGVITGTVIDTSGAVIPGAEVTITNKATLRATMVTTNPTGFYSASALEAGIYDVSIKKEGFKAFVSEGVKLDPGENLGQNATLELGSTTTTVTVAASAAKIETVSGESSGTITGSHVQQLMINGRNYLGLALLIPGVNSASISGRAGVGGGSLNAGGLTGESPISVNGLGRDQSALYTIDGSYNMAVANSINMPIVPPLDTISEFRLLKDNYSAKYGGTGSAQVMVESKSGSQSFHGAVYEFLRNDKVDAAPFFTPIDPVTNKKVKLPLRQNNYGFAFSGPFYIPGKFNVDKKKAFVFYNEEWRSRLSPLTARGAMIPQDMRNGDFTNSPTRPATGLVFDAVARNTLSLLYPGVNCLPDSTHVNPACFDQNAVKIMNDYWPLPNIPSAGFLNYINPGVDKVNSLDDTIRFDYYISEKLVVMGRLMRELTTDLPPALVWGPNPAPTTTQRIRTRGLNTLLRFTANISPTTINQFSWNVGGFHPDLRSFNTTLPSGITLNRPFSGNLSNRIPQIGLAGGWAGLAAEPFPIDARDAYRTYSDDFTLAKGNHVMQAGEFLIFGIKNQDLFAASNGNYFFSGVHTGDAVADFLIGLNDNFSQTSDRRKGFFRYWQFEPYFQDDWKVTRRLTLNLGLRYYYFSPDTMDGDGFGDFDPKKWDPAKAPAVQKNGLFVQDPSTGVSLTAQSTPADELNGVILPGKGGVPRGIYNAWKKGFAPRIGFAWDVRGDGKTAVRGGYGVGYHRIPFGNYVAMNNPPFISSISLINGTFTNPSFGAQAAPRGPSGMTLVGLGTFRPSYVQTWSLTVDRQIVTNAVLSVAYVGSGARQLVASRDINFPLRMAAPYISNPSCLMPGQTAAAGGFDFDPCLNRSLVSPDFTRPFVGWSGLTANATTTSLGYYGTSNYNSLQVGFKYTTARHLTLNTAYTWGKALTDVADRGFDARTQTGGAQNPRNYKAEYGPPGFDRTNILTAGYIYELPFLRNRRGVLGQAFGNWTFSGITVIESGFAFAPGLAVTKFTDPATGKELTAGTGLAGRPDCVGSFSGPKTLNNWFNTAAVAYPKGFGLFGNCGTGLIRGPGENTWNWAVFKSFPIRERAKLQFRAEFFNVWNHPNFSGVSTSLGAGDFGQVTSALEERQLEFGLRLEF